MRFICGIDEVGRGALAGPILAVAAAFSVEDQADATVPPIVGLADSKTFSKQEKRERVGHELLRCPRLVGVGIGQASVEEINHFGIDYANQVIFIRAMRALGFQPHFLYVDGNNAVDGYPKDCQCVEPKADSKYWTVSAASILAKITRDRLMGELHVEYPQYAWSSNMGYGSKAHQDGLKQYGPTVHHRRQFIRKLL